MKFHEKRLRSFFKIKDTHIEQTRNELIRNLFLIISLYIACMRHKNKSSMIPFANVTAPLFD